MNHLKFDGDYSAFKLSTFDASSLSHKILNCKPFDNLETTVQKILSTKASICISVLVYPIVWLTSPIFLQCSANPIVLFNHYKYEIFSFLKLFFIHQNRHCLLFYTNLWLSMKKARGNSAIEFHLEEKCSILEESMIDILNMDSLDDSLNFLQLLSFSKCTTVEERGTQALRQSSILTSLLQESGSVTQMRSYDEVKNYWLNSKTIDRSQFLGYCLEIKFKCIFENTEVCRIVNESLWGGMYSRESHYM